MTTLSAGEKIMKNIILASGSPRRIEIMRRNGFEPEIRPADVNEDLPFYMMPESAVMYLALKKNLHTANKYNMPDSIYISADTVVAYKGRIIGKPSDSNDAFKTLSELRNDCHSVITGVCILETGPDADRNPESTAGMPANPAAAGISGSISFIRKICFYESTSVFFKNYSDEELAAYVSTDEPYDKAGGYAIQGTFGRYIDHIDGDYDNVVGFPWNKIAAYLY